MVIWGLVTLILGAWIFYRSISERKTRSKLKTIGIAFSSLLILFMGLGLTIPKSPDNTTTTAVETTKSQSAKKDKAKTSKLAASRSEYKRLVSKKANSEKAAADSKAESERIAYSKEKAEADSKAVSESIASSKSTAESIAAASVSESENIARSESVASEQYAASLSASIEQSQQQSSAPTVEDSQTPISTSGYTKDARGRWHRSNGQFASKAEIAQAGLTW